MSELFNEVNWILIFALIALSVLVSWFGDVVGMKLGKKRITFLGLRPKYTSRIISVLTGLGIAMVVMVGLSMASEQVRTALFSMQYVQSQLLSLRNELRTNQDSMYKMQVDLLQSRGDLSDKEKELYSVSAKLETEMKDLEKTRADLAKMKAARAKTEAEQKRLTEENQKLVSESKKLDESVNKLRRESESLKSGIQKMRKGKIAAFSGEILAQSVVEGEKITGHKIDEHIERMRTQVREIIAYRSGKKPSEINMPQVSPESVANAKSKTVNTNDRWLLRLTALGNVFYDDTFVQVKLETYKSKLVYKTGHVLYSHKFEKGTKQPEVEQALYIALRSMNQKAADDGILRDPITGDVGSLDSNEFMNAIEKIAKSTKDLELEISAAKDVYTEGPLGVTIKLK